MIIQHSRVTGSTLVPSPFAVGGARQMLLFDDASPVPVAEPYSPGSVCTYRAWLGERVQLLATHVHTGPAAPLPGAYRERATALAGPIERTLFEIESELPDGRIVKGSWRYRTAGFEAEHIARVWGNLRAEFAEYWLRES